MNSLTIECRNKESLSGGDNLNTNFGSFTTTLPQGIKIMEGDSIQLKSVFVDTQDSQKVIINEEDANVEMDICYYNLNYRTTDKEYNDTSPTTETMPDGGVYFVCKTIPANQGANLRRITSITVSPVGNQPSYGDVDITISVPDPAHNGTQTKNITFFIPQTEKSVDGYTRTINGNSGGKNPNGTDKNPNFGKLPFDYYDPRPNGQNTPDNDLTNLFSLVNPDERTLENDHNLLFKGGDGVKSTFQMVSDQVLADGQSPLHIETISFTLATGVYEPNEIAQVITDKLAQLQLDNTKTTIDNGKPLDNPFLRTISQIRTQQGYSNVNNPKIYLFQNNGDNYFRYTTIDSGQDYYAGANEVALSFNSDLSKFEFTSLHMPYYYTNQIATNYFSSGTAGKLILVNKEGGVAFTGLRPESLWFNKLGFTSANLINPSMTTKSYGGGQRNNWRVIQLGEINDGAKTTGAYLGLDTAINKTDPLKVPTLGGNNPVGFTSTSTIPIVASESLNNALNIDPYFLVEVNINANQELYGRNKIKNNIKAVVGKYYSVDNFTSGSTLDAVYPYIHKGEPLVLSDISIRILDPQHNLAQGIGKDNTVFLEIIRAPQQPSVNNDKKIRR
jgi:hypothetical protein